MLRCASKALSASPHQFDSNELREAIKNAHDSGTGAAYTLSRSGFNRNTLEPEFTETVVVPSAREIERLELDAPAISEGWL